MTKYEQMEKLLKSLAPPDNEDSDISEIWRVSYLDRFNKNASDEDKERIYKLNKLEYGANPSFASILKYILSKKAYNAIETKPEENIEDTELPSE